jgi:hypothetical protein
VTISQVRVTEYAVCALPEGDINASHFTIKVAYRGDGRWAVLRHGRCLGSDGEWDYESIPSEREDEWLATHRFDEDTALRLAAEQVPHIKVNGWTVADALAAAERREG